MTRWTGLFAAGCWVVCAGTIVWHASADEQDALAVIAKIDGKATLDDKGRVIAVDI
jgi:hypothetical protein